MITIELVGGPRCGEVHEVPQPRDSTTATTPITFVDPFPVVPHKWFRGAGGDASLPVAPTVEYRLRMVPSRIGYPHPAYTPGGHVLADFVKPQTTVDA